MDCKRNGYALAHDPYKNRPNYAHRVIMQNALGRQLLPSELVHHVNGDKLDNRLANLELTTRSEHAKRHIEEGTWSGATDSGPRPQIRLRAFRVCPQCFQPFKRWSRQGVSTTTCSVSCSNRWRAKNSDEQELAKEKARDLEIREMPLHPDVLEAMIQSDTPKRGRLRR